MTIFSYGEYIIEFLSMVLILSGFEFFNRKDIRGFYVMGAGQLIATLVCAGSHLWFLAFMHFVIFLMQIRGYTLWRKDDLSNLK